MHFLAKLVKPPYIRCLRIRYSVEILVKKYLVYFDREVHTREKEEINLVLTRLKWPSRLGYGAAAVSAILLLGMTATAIPPHHPSHAQSAGVPLGSVAHPPSASPSIASAPLPHTIMVIATEAYAPVLATMAQESAFPAQQSQHSTDRDTTLSGVQSIRPLLRFGAANPELAREFRLDRTFTLSIDPRLDVQAVAEEFRRLNSRFEHVEVDHITQAHTDTDSNNQPNDPLFTLQYNLHNTGQTVNGVAGLPSADIHALDAWNITRGSDDVVVAVFDAGISQSHPDLAPKLVPGWNFITDSSDTDDENTSHGTHVAGIIAALTSNRKGIAAISWQSKLMPIVVLNKFGFGSESPLAEGIVWAADHGARVGSVSLGYMPDDGSQNDQILHAAVTYATLQGMLLVASTGNTPTNPIAAPARYPETIAVGATDNRDMLWDNTATGPEMTVTAPGVAIWSTWDSTSRSPGENTYAALTGTSQACPHVSGLAALLFAINPQLTPIEVTNIITKTADDLGPTGWDPHYGFGRINAGSAVHEAQKSKEDDLQEGQIPCTADFNFDGKVNIGDFTAYINAFNNENWRADLADPKGVFNTLDLITFSNAYVDGCTDKHLDSTGIQP